MTVEKAIKILKSWQNVAYHNADNLIDEHTGEVDTDSAELYEALNVAIPLLKKSIKTERKTLK